MTRVKKAVTAHKRHKKVLALTKGQRATRSKLYRRAHEAMLKSLSYAYAHRRKRRGDMRRLWIARINAAAREAGLTYRELIHGLNLANIKVDRKILSDLAISNNEDFKSVVETARTALAAAA